MSTLGELLGFEKTLLGVDMVQKGGIVLRDCSEQDILKYLEVNQGKHVKIAVSPIGGQGFFLGRGNLQISPRVVRKVGIDDIIVLSTPHKLESTKILRVDTGDHALDSEIRSRGVLKVLVGYRSYRLVKIE